MDLMDRQNPNIETIFIRVSSLLSLAAHDIQV
jgi:hypothetical protein